MCAGVTVFAPLLRYASGATRLGVIGIGGLGHLALQYGRALGCHVTAFTSTPDKADEAREFGAHEVIDTSQAGALAARAFSCDLLLCTVTADLPWNDYVGVLRRNGKLCPDERREHCSRAPRQECRALPRRSGEWVTEFTPFPSP
jgi:alcohol/geraniol dehydrogenase (NADP+)